MLTEFRVTENTHIKGRETEKETQETERGGKGKLFGC